MTRILITGASGLLGVNLAFEAAGNHQVIGVVNENSLRTNAFETIQANLLNPGEIERILEVAQPDWVIHCAALANVDQCEREPNLAEKLNTDLPGKLSEYVSKGGARQLHVSTDAVFDGWHGNYSETDSPNPLSIYARTKLEGEYAVQRANPDAIIARVNLYGWSVSGTRSLAEFFYNNLYRGNEINGFTDVFFCPLYARDLGKIFLEMLAKKMNGLFHVISGECTSKYDFGVRIAKVFGFDPDLINPTTVTKAGLSAQRSPNLTLKSEKLSNALGKQLPGIDDGIYHFYQHYQEGFNQLLQEIQDIA